MREKIWFYIEECKWLLPIISAMCLIFALPPVSIWQLSIVGYVPLFYFVYICISQASVNHSSSLRDDVLGTTLFAMIYAGYISYTTLAGFNWLAEAEYFVTFVHIAGTLAVFFVGFVYVLYVYAAIKLLRRTVWFANADHGLVSALIVVGTIIPELFFFYAYKGFNFGAVFFAGQEIASIRSFIDFGVPMIISLVVMAINICIAYVLLVVLGRASHKALCWVAGVVLVIFVCFWLVSDAPQMSEDTLRVAIIQEASRDPEVSFGKVVDGVFAFPVLEDHIDEAMKSNPDIIVYPFAPWNGVISSSIDNSRFDRDVIGISDAIFSAWLKEHVPEDVIFAAWYTSYRDGKYYNQIGYHKNGDVDGVYTKEKLFPFFDYVPSWALRSGIVSLPYDGTPGVHNETYLLKDTIPVGTLVCSEIGDMTATYNSAVAARIIFSLGSETMFNHQIPSEYNALRASLSAELHDIPVVRANKFGPSVVFDGNGEEIGRIGFEETGVLIVDIPIPAAKE